MKYKIGCLIVSATLIAACNQPEKEIKQKDSVLTESIATAPVTGDLVKSEAPDAVNKKEMGYALPRYDEGMVQSPINILTDSTVKDNSPGITVKYNTGIKAVENLGHTIQVDFDEGSITLAGGKTYTTKQFHFHTPSEHLIDGMTFPMEMHIVNVLKDSSEKNNPKYLVIALLFKMGRENKFIKEFLHAVPLKEGKDTLSHETVHFEDLSGTVPKSESSAYYTYNGSLTTPPYSETVKWIVLKYIMEASPEQIFAIEKLEGNNARHVRALYSRTVLSH